MTVDARRARAKCHPDRAVKAAGLCRACYVRRSGTLSTRNADLAYAKLVALTGERCAICGGTNDNGWRLSVDHVHGTDILRGLLCHRCNIGLGQFRDSPRILRLAADYIDRGGSR